MRRVSVIGAAGAGKTSLSRRLAEALGAPRVELDALYWGPDWTPRPEAEFHADTERAMTGDAWVVDGNYSTLQPAIWARADTVVWLDPPRHVVLRRVVGRTVRRAIDQRELWSGTGNRQHIGKIFPWRQDSIIRWSWQQLDRYPERYGRAMADPANAHLTFHRLRTRRDVHRLLDEVAFRRA